jgi:hypothetical protein
MLEAGEGGRGADRLDVGQVMRGEDRIAKGVRDANGADDGVRDGAAEEGDLARTGDAEVGDVLPAAAEEAVIFLAANRCADSVLRHAHPAVPAPARSTYFWNHGNIGG